MSAKTWFITGCSSGLGRALAEFLLERGDRVVLTARDPGSITDLAGSHPEQALALKLDVTDEAQAQAAIAAALERFGCIDVLVNNAGVAVHSPVENATDAEVRAAFDTNVFGLLNVTRAALPVLRNQKSGHIINISSGAGRMSAPMIGIYSATKHAVEGLTQALAMEAAPHGIKVTAVAPGAYETRLSDNSIKTRTSEAYAGAAQAMEAFLAAGRFAPPVICARVIAAVADLDEAPVRIPAGTDAVAMLRPVLEAQLAELDRWEAVAVSGDT